MKKGITMSNIAFPSEVVAGAGFEPAVWSPSWVMSPVTSAGLVDPASWWRWADLNRRSTGYEPVALGR